MKKVLVFALILSACGDSRLSPQGGTITSVQGGSGLTGGGTGGLVTLNVGAGTGVTVNPNDIAVDTSVIQARVTGTCASGNAIRIINADGTVTCQTTTSFSTLNVIPKGDGTGLAASSLTDNGTDVSTTENMYVGLTAGTAAQAILNVGRNTSVATNAENGWRVNAFTDGNVYVDHKTVTAGHVFYRFGSGANNGQGNTWMDLTLSNGLTTFPFSVAIGNNLYGSGDDTYFGWDGQTNARIGFTKKVGSVGKLTYGSGNSFAIAQSSATNIAAAGTFTDRFVIDSSGNITAGSGTATANTLTFNGREVVLNSAPSALTTSTSLLGVVRTGTFDTTAGLVTNGGVNVSVTSTRSAGANDLFNRAARFTASGAQINRAIQTDDGEVSLNTSTGNTCIGSTGCSSRLSVSGAANSNVITAANTQTGQTSSVVMVSADTAATFTPALGVSMSGFRAYLTSTRTGGAGTLTNLAADFSASGADGNVALRTVAGDVRLVDTSGNVGVADSSPTNKLTVTGAASATSGLYTNEARTIGINESGTTLQFRTNNLDAQMTLDASANLTLKGNATLGDTPASDTHTINGVTIVKGGSTTSQVQLSDAIGNYWGIGRDNLSTGDFHISTSTGTKVAISSSVVNNVLVINSSSMTVKMGTPTAAAAPAGSILVLEQADGVEDLISFRAAGISGLVFSKSSSSEGSIKYNAISNGLTFSTNNDGIKLAIPSTGGMSVGDTSLSAVANNVDVITLGNTGTAQTASKALINATHSGTFNTTGGGITNIGFFVNITATRASGANDLTNKAASFSASGGQVNLALETDLGDNRFNVSGGQSEFRGNTLLGNQETDFVNSQATMAFSGTDVTINTCGTSPSVTGEAQSFQVTVGSGVTSCVVNLNRTFNSAPYCTFSAANAAAGQDVGTPTGNAAAPYVTSTTTTVTLNFAGNTEGSPIYNVWCPDRR